MWSECYLLAFSCKNFSQAIEPDFQEEPPSQHSGKWVKYSGNIYELNGGGMCSKKALGHFFAWQTTAQPGGAWF